MGKSGAGGGAGSDLLTQPLPLERRLLEERCALPLRPVPGGLGGGADHSAPPRRCPACSPQGAGSLRAQITAGMTGRQSPGEFLSPLPQLVRFPPVAPHMSLGR